MEALNRKRAHLRHELQVAYDAWMVASEQQAGDSDTARPIDISGSLDAARAQWLDYLTAKQRLVAAYAELPLAA